MSEQTILTVDIRQDALIVGRFIPKNELHPAYSLKLRLPESGASSTKRSQYTLHAESPEVAFEKLLADLSKRGELRSTTLVLGMLEDPCHPFEQHFRITLRLLEKLTRYQPGGVIIQTRSPLLVIAAPVLKTLQGIVRVTVALETTDDTIARNLTPNLPRPTERLKLMQTLKTFGVPVTAQLYPVLPYGNWEKDAQHVAATIAQHASTIILGPLCESSRRSDAPLAQHLAESRMFKWLRSDAHLPLEKAFSKINPKLLELPSYLAPLPEQMNIFVA